MDTSCSDSVLICKLCNLIKSCPITLQRQIYKKGMDWHCLLSYIYTLNLVQFFWFSWFLGFLLWAKLLLRLSRHSLLPDLDLYNLLISVENKFRKLISNVKHCAVASWVLWLVVSGWVWACWCLTCLGAEVYVLTGSWWWVCDLLIWDGDTTYVGKFPMQWGLINSLVLSVCKWI